MKEGWFCPRCGRVNAPFTPYCGCELNKNSNILNYTCKHEWICDGMSTGGTHYTCKICGKTKTE